MKKKTIQYKNVRLMVDLSNGKVFQSGKELKIWYNKHLNRRYIMFYDNEGNRRISPYARVICLAAHPNKDYAKLQADHIDSDTMNDSPSNLQWLTRKKNNVKDHARMLRQKNGKRTSHDGQHIRATLKCESSQVIWFKNGHQAAKFLGVSHVAVYKTLDPTTYNKTCAGYMLEWVDDSKVPAIVLEEERHDMDEKAQARKYKAEEAKKLREAKQRAKQMLKTTKQIDKLKQRIANWQKHIENIDIDCVKQKERIAKKIKFLAAEAERLAKEVL